MNVGDKLTLTPSSFDHEVSGQRADKVRKLRSIPGVIAYIHPAGRYYMAEAKVGNEIIRECFPIENR